MDLEFQTLNGTPIFAIQSTSPDFSRTYGAVFDKDNRRWVFPAYPPFADLVLSDLKRVAPTLKLSPTADAQVRWLEDVKNVLLPQRRFPDIEFKTKPFDHQIEGLAMLYHHPRYALFWDPGTGKSKVIVDLLRLLQGQRALIITPKVTVRNWLREIKVHAGDTLKAAVLDGDVTRKRKLMRNYEEYDVLITSYGSARTLGHPHVLARALKRLKEAVAQQFMSENMAEDLAKVIRRHSDSERQEDFVWAKLFGATLPQIDRYITEELKGLGPQWLEEIDYRVIVADESHSIKEQTSQQTKSVIALSKKAARRYIMSGTPTLGDPRHLYPQMKFLSPFIIPEDWLRFSDKFLIRARWNKKIVVGFQNMNVLNDRVQRVATRKTKEECLDLPERLPPIDVPFELVPEQKKIYNSLISAMALDLTAFFNDPTGSLLEVQNAATLLNKLCQVTSGFVINSGKRAEICNGCSFVQVCVSSNIMPYTPRCQVQQTDPGNEVKIFKENPKLEALEELLETILAEPSHKVILWAVYKAEMDMIEELLEKRKKLVGSWVRVDGSTGTKVQDRVDHFNTDPDCRVYLGQIATGVGITLNAASYMIYFTLDWSLGNYLQSIDRNYRAGQTKKCTVYRLLGENTVDWYKARALDEKRDISATLTHKIACATCQKRFECLKDKVELFDPGCIYQRRAMRTVAKAGVIE